MKNKFWKNVEWSILFASLILFGVGLVALYSATKQVGHEEFYKQIRWFLITIPIFIGFLTFDYTKIAKYSVIYYIILIAMLVAVLFTPERGGGSRWFNLGAFLFQPSELGKLVMIIFVSWVISRIQIKGRDNINKIYNLLIPILLVGIAIALIMRQPDYGTALAYIIAASAIIFVSGIRKRYFAPLLILGGIALYFVWVYIIPTYAPHVLKRIEIFLNPGLDPRGAGYNAIQSKLAVGSGHIFGMGLGEGNQTQMGYLYPKTTDFIFSMISEELGFIVAGGLIIVYIFLVVKGIHVAKTAKDNLGSYIAIGIVAVIFYQVVENIGMTIGILPISGLPLPFISYGGTALITNFIYVAVLLNISGNRQKAIFVDIEDKKKAEAAARNRRRKSIDSSDANNIYNKSNPQNIY